MDKEATLLFDLNKRALDFRNSKQYFIGDRIIHYGTLLKHGHIIKFIKIENYCIYCLEKGNTYTCLKIGLV